MMPTGVSARTQSLHCLKPRSPPCCESGIVPSQSNSENRASDHADGKQQQQHRTEVLLPPPPPPPSALSNHPTDHASLPRGTQQPYPLPAAGGGEDQLTCPAPTPSFGFPLAAHIPFTGNNSHANSAMYTPLTNVCPTPLPSPQQQQQQQCFLPPAGAPPPGLGPYGDYLHHFSPLLQQQQGQQGCCYYALPVSQLTLPASGAYPGPYLYSPMPGGGLPSAVPSLAAAFLPADVFNDYYAYCMRTQQQYAEEQLLKHQWEQQQLPQQPPHIPEQQQQHQHQQILQVAAAANTSPTMSSFLTAFTAYREAVTQQPHQQQQLQTEGGLGKKHALPTVVDAPALTCGVWSPTQVGARPARQSGSSHHHGGVEARATARAAAATACTPPPVLDSLLSDDAATANTSGSTGSGHLTPFNLNTFHSDHCLTCGADGHTYTDCRAAPPRSLCVFSDHDKHVYMMHHDDWYNSATLGDVVNYVEAALHTPRALFELWLDGRSLATIGSPTRTNMALPPRDLRTTCRQLRLLPGAAVFVSSPGVWDGRARDLAHKAVVEEGRGGGGGRMEEPPSSLSSSSVTSLPSRDHREARLTSRWKVTGSGGDSVEGRPREALPRVPCHPLRRPSTNTTPYSEPHHQKRSHRVAPHSCSCGTPKEEKEEDEESEASSSADEQRGARVPRLTLSAPAVSLPIATTTKGDGKSGEGKEPLPRRSSKGRDSTSSTTSTTTSEGRAVDLSTISAAATSELPSVPLTTLAAAAAADRASAETKPKLQPLVNLPSAHHGNGSEGGKNVTMAADSEETGKRERKSRGSRGKKIKERDDNHNHNHNGDDEDGEEEDGDVDAHPTTGRISREVVMGWLAVPLHPATLAAQSSIVAERAKERSNRAVYESASARRRRTLHVKFLPETLSFRDIRELFAQFGELLRVRVICPQQPTHHEPPSSTNSPPSVCFHPADNVKHRAKPPLPGKAGQQESNTFLVSFVEYSCEREAAMAKRFLQGKRVGKSHFLAVDQCRQPITGGYRTDYDAATGKPCTFGLTQEQLDEVNRSFGFRYTGGSGASAATSTRPVSAAAAVVAGHAATADGATGVGSRSGSRTPPPPPLLQEGKGRSQHVKVEEEGEVSKGKGSGVATAPAVADRASTTPASARLLSSPLYTDSAPSAGVTSLSSQSLRSTGPPSAKDGGGGSSVRVVPLTALPPPLPRELAKDDRQVQRLAKDILTFFYFAKDVSGDGSGKARHVAATPCVAFSHWTADDVATLSHLRHKLRASACRFVSGAVEPLFHSSLSIAQDLLAYPGIRQPRGDGHEDSSGSSSAVGDAGWGTHAGVPHPLFLQLETLVTVAALYIHHDSHGDGRQAALAAQQALTAVHRFTNGLTQLQFLCATHRQSNATSTGHNTSNPCTALPRWRELFTAVPLATQFNPRALATLRDAVVLLPLPLPEDSPAAAGTDNGTTSSPVEATTTPPQATAATAPATPFRLDIPFPRLDACYIMMERLLQLALVLDVYMTYGTDVLQGSRLDGSHDSEESAKSLATGKSANNNSDSNSNNASKSAEALETPPPACCTQRQQRPLPPTTAMPNVLLSPLTLPRAVDSSNNSGGDCSREERQARAARQASAAEGGSQHDASNKSQVNADGSGASAWSGLLLDTEDAGELQFIHRVKVELVSVAGQLYRQLCDFRTGAQELGIAQAYLNHALEVVNGGGSGGPTGTATRKAACPAMAPPRQWEEQEKEAGEPTAAQHFWVALEQLMKERVPRCAAVSGHSKGEARSRHNRNTTLPTSTTAASNNNSSSSSNGRVLPGAGVLLASLVPHWDKAGRYAAMLLANPAACELI